MTRYNVIKELAGDPRVSRDPRRHWPTLDTVPQAWPLNVWVRVPSAFNSYGDDHKRLRRLISTAFTPRRTEALRPGVQALVDGLIDQLRQIPPGEVIDLRSRYAYVIPTEVICDLFGVPDGIRSWTRRVIVSALNTDATPEQAAADFAELQDCMRHLIDLKRNDPGHDMTSDLIAARDDDDKLSEDELVATLILMIGAGSETAVNLILRGARALTQRELMHLLRQDATSFDDVIEEALRIDGPIMHMPLRYAVEDIDLGDGVTIRQGDAILLAFGAAGRDPAINHDPDTFDATRATKKHLAFGHGAHYCLGAPLAKLEANIALRALFDAFPHAELAVAEAELQPQESFIANGPRAMPVILQPSPQHPMSGQ